MRISTLLAFLLLAFLAAASLVDAKKVVVVNGPACGKTGKTCLTGTKAQGGKPCCSKADYCASNGGRAGSKGTCKKSYVPKPNEVQTKCAALGGKCFPFPPKGVAPCCDSGALCITTTKQAGAPGTCQNL